MLSQCGKPKLLAFFRLQAKSVHLKISLFCFCFIWKTEVERGSKWFSQVSELSPRLLFWWQQWMFLNHHMLPCRYTSAESWIRNRAARARTENSNMGCGCPKQQNNHWAKSLPQDCIFTYNMSRPLVAQLFTVFWNFSWPVAVNEWNPSLQNSVLICNIPFF